jgi:hypothetical protein
MRPFETTTLTDKQWALAEPGRNYLVYSSSGSSIRLDLPGEGASYVVNRVNLSNGQMTALGERGQGGEPFEFAVAGSGPCVLWLTRK